MTASQGRESKVQCWHPLADRLLRPYSANWINPSQYGRALYFGRISLTQPTVIRLLSVTGSEIDLRRAAERFVRNPAATAFEPTVTPNPFDTIEEHVGNVYRYALRLTRRADAAEDLTQETMLRCWRNRENLRDPRVTRVWLLKIATNLWNDQLRRRKHETKSIIADPPCPRATASMIGDARESVELALAAMDELPPRQRQVLYLITCEQMTNDEVANVLELSEVAVKANLSLARKEMRRRLKDIYAEVCGRRACQNP
jgi:RNA polymerase sigma-70 factor (ECF subfamily)